MATSKRRPLNAALDMGAEKLAFIRGGVPDSSDTEIISRPGSVELPPEAALITQPKTDAPPIELEQVVEPDTPERKKIRTKGRGIAQVRDEPMMSTENLLVPLTTRLSPTTAAALKRAGLEQRLYGRKPATVQEIAEEAIRAWLGEQRYL